MSVSDADIIQSLIIHKSVVIFPSSVLHSLSSSGQTPKPFAGLMLMLQHLQRTQEGRHSSRSRARISTVRDPSHSSSTTSAGHVPTMQRWVKWEQSRTTGCGLRQSANKLFSAGVPVFSRRPSPDRAGKKQTAVMITSTVMMMTRTTAAAAAAASRRSPTRTV